MNPSDVSVSVRKTGVTADATTAGVSTRGGKAERGRRWLESGQDSLEQTSVRPL